MWQLLIMDISNDEKDEQFIDMLYNKRYTYSTAKDKYKKYLNGRKSNMILNHNLFNKKQTRLIPEVESIINYNNFVENQYYILNSNPCKSNKSDKYKYMALLFAILGFLRRAEILRLTKTSLCLLKNKATKIPIQIKYSNVWEPVYHDKFVIFIDSISLEDFDKEQLFDFSESTLLRSAKLAYFKANKTKPLLGFGLHTSRYYLASTTNNIKSAQRALNHASHKTTYGYKLPLITQANLNRAINSNSFYRSLL